MPATQPKTRTEQILEKNTILQEIVTTLQKHNQLAQEEIKVNHPNVAIEHLTTIGDVVASLQEQANEACNVDLTKPSLYKRERTINAVNKLKALTKTVTNLTNEMQHLLLLANQKSDLIQAQEAQYNEQLGLLETFELPDASPVKSHLDKVLAQVKLMKKSGEEEVETLTDILKMTNRMLKSKPDAIEYYKKFAERVQGKSSPAMKILGGLMVALGTVMMAIGAVTGVVPAMVGGGALAAAGIGFFAYGKQSGLAKTMDNLAEAQTVQESTQGLRA